MATLLYILLCQAVGLTGGWLTRAGLTGWYQQIKKPWFNPPGWVFGPVWTLLYTMMGVAAARVVHDPLCCWLFFAQLLLNGLWSLLFFGRRSPALALLDIVLLWVAIAGCVAAFAPVDEWAARLFWPYWAWVSFATLLNFEIWRLNR